MKSVRLDARLESRLRRAALTARISESELIRQGVEQRTNQILGDELDPRWDGIIGAVHSGRGRARNTSQAFTELLVREHKGRSKRRS